jgi:peptidoglycan/LPS O-acetylase OafA/YrhL
MVVAAGGRRWILLAIFLVSLFAEPIARYYGLNESQRGIFLFKTVSLFQTTQFFSYFMAGVVAWAYRDRITWNKGYFALCLLLLFAAQNSLTAPLILKLCLPYIVLFVGLYNGTGSKLKRKIGDLSYGVYLIGYPAINSVISLGAMKLSPEVVFGIAASISLIFAWFSWRLVERPALKLKSRLVPKSPISEPLRNKASAETA